MKTILPPLSTPCVLERLILFLNIRDFNSLLLINKSFQSLFPTHTHRITWNGYTDQKFYLSPVSVACAISNNANDGTSVDLLEISRRMARAPLAGTSSLHKNPREWHPWQNTNEETIMAKQMGRNFVEVVEELRRTFVSGLGGSNKNPITGNVMDQKVLVELTDKENYAEVSMEKRGRG